MTAMNNDALSLRFSGSDRSGLVADVAAFSSHTPSSTPAREAVVLNASASQAPPVIFFRHATYRIPEPGRALPPLSFEDWNLRPTLFGYIAQPRPATRRTPLSSVAWVAAACLPLLMGTTAQAAPAKKAPVQRPGTLVPSAPGDAQAEAAPEADAETTTETEPSAEGEPAEPEIGGPPALPPDDSTEPDAPVDLYPEADRPPPPPTPDPFDGTPTFQTAGATVDAAWQGVDGHRVIVRLKDGKTLDGTIGALQRSTFTLLDTRTGVVMVLPKSSVSSLRAYRPKPIPTDTGTGYVIGGTALTVVGAPVFISGVAILALCPSCVGLNVSLLVIGGGALAGGIPLLVRGVRKRRAFRDAMNEHAVSPSLSWTRDGWNGGVRFRF